VCPNITLRLRINLHDFKDKNDNSLKKDGMDNATCMGDGKLPQNFGSTPEENRPLVGLVH
jgi:hypothetical protein